MGRGGVEGKCGGGGRGEDRRVLFGADLSRGV